MKPQRIKLKRTKGFNLQAVSQALNGLPAVSVARPSRWGNPERVAVVGDRIAVATFERKLREGMLGPIQAIITCEVVRQELRGKNLACYCGPGGYCHADVLLKIANEEGQ